MIMNPADVLNPVFNFLNVLISDYGVYLYLVFVWLSLGVIAWVLSGGLQRSGSHDNAATVVPGIIITLHPPNQSPPPIIVGDFDSVQNHDNEMLDEQDEI